MAFTSLHNLYLLFSLFLIFRFSTLKLVTGSKPVVSSYIVHTDAEARPSPFSTQDDWYAYMMSSLTDHKTDSPYGSRIFYTYSVVFHGFAARLTDQEAEKLTKTLGIIVVFKDKVRLKLDTTRSPGFLGLGENFGLWPDTNFGDNIIIGLVDSGIWPESDSFKDNGLGPVPSHWKGACEEGTKFNSSNCNKKLIGARFFLKGFEHYTSIQPMENDFVYYFSPRDGHGHGTHTASTAAGAKVERANVFGFANGTAQGVAPKARIAMYKACAGGCAESDILAAMESAIEDGVDILSLSIGIQDPPYYEDPIAKGAFAAVRRNIFVCCSAGNLGPHPFSTHNTAPWITTVGAGSIDRSFPVQILLGNNKSLTGSSLYPGKISTNSFPLVYLENCGSAITLPDHIMGKIVICNSTKSEAVKNGHLVQASGGVGLIQLNRVFEGEGLVAISYTLPSATVGYKEAMELLSYINTTKNPIASFRIHNLTVVGKERAPIVLSFSARGPNPVVPEVLKPDIIAPGLNILAAWPTNIPPSRSPYDPRRVNFNTDSGTSMAVPHVAGVAALLRAAHPNWSPAAIRSALMTTSATIDSQDRPIISYEDMEPATPISVGSGHVNPQLATDPGLIYDADISDYTKFLCSLNYTKEQMKVFVDGPSTCSSYFSSPGDLNYPSFCVVFKPKNYVIELKRTVTNVAEVLPERYKVRIVNARAEKFAVSVEPRDLIFERSYEKQSYRVKFKSNYVFDNSSSIVEQMVFGSISWESDRHIVRSPFTVMWDKS
ncbi:subtilisin-like protease SBT1.7 [Actinidia eriantha]|uniref:subtilisin-like protease SBT1.7 n=1 Tax=Actinidia eriantha TaxID=165200 RepID=UPI00258E4AB9|nr:subtilisin-like protease SBT1.7 [Actinidia eriantha]